MIKAGVRSLGVQGPLARSSPVLSRKCVCGAHTPGGATCMKCGNEANGLLQRQPTGKKLPPPVLEAPYPLEPLVQDHTPKTNAEEYKEGGGKLIEAALATEQGTAATEKVIGALTATPLRTVGTLTALGGTIAGLAVTGKELPIQMPFVALPERFVRVEGLSVKFILNGPINNPTEGVLVFRYEPPADKKPKLKEEVGDFFPSRNSFAANDQGLSDAGISYAVAQQEKARFARAAEDAKQASEPAPPGALTLKRPGRLGGDAPSGPIAPLLLGGELKLELPPFLLPKAEVPTLQKRLAIGASDDPLEAEADRAADAALARAPGEVAGHAPLSLRRQETGRGGGWGEAPASVDRVLASGGAPLDEGLRADMEGRFGHDFSGVRVYHDAAAAQSARDVAAHAYTAGNAIVFGAGQFSPGAGEGRRLLAHELAHVVQQGAQPLSASAAVRRRDANALDAKASAIIAAAKDDKTGIEDRAKKLVQAIVDTYWDASKVGEIVYKESENGLVTTPVGKGAAIKGKITVGRYFVENVDKFARRVLQVGHELQHVDQQRGGMGGADKSNEREFLAHSWTAKEPEKANTGRVSHSTRVDMVDEALGNYHCMPEDKRTLHKAEMEALLDLRRTEQTASGKDPTEPPKACVK